jgi:transmembrane sensor
VDRSLLNKFFLNDCSVQETIQVVKWINSFESQKEFEQEFQKLWNELHSCQDFDWQRAFNELNEKIEMEDLIHHLPVQSMKDQMEYKIKPDKEKNRSFPFAYAAAVVSSIIVTAVLIMYNMDDQPQEMAIESKYVTKSTEPGQKLTILLEDGSKVMLNSGSNLTYPEPFSDSSREIKLEGEAFFEVARDFDRPFVVNSGNLTTTVLGTTFNIHYYQDQPIKISLVTGKVLIDNEGEELILNPGEQISYSEKDQVMQKRSFDYRKEIGWREGVIFFENADFADIVNTLERWYGVRISVKGNPASNWVYQGIFDNQSLRVVLQRLSFSKEFEYFIEGKNVTIKF